MHVLVVGGGHASLPLLASARDLTGHEVTLVSDCEHLWYSGMTPEYLGGVYTREDVTIDLRAICRGEGVRFIAERAVHLDPFERFVETASGLRLPYDVLAVDVGATNPARDRAPDAVRTKPLHRIAALDAFLREARETSNRKTLVIVGGGAAGVEVALNVSARPDPLALTIIEPGDALLGGFPKRAQRWAAQTLRERGVSLRLGAEVDRVEGEHVRLTDGSSLRADRVLWATGSVGQGWLTDALQTGKRGFVRVSASLQARGHPRIFVAGDAALVDGHEDLARVGVHAVKQGPTLRENVHLFTEALARREAPETIALQSWRPYPTAPLILSTGNRDGLFVAGPLAIRGTWALALKHRVDRKWIEPYLSTTPSWDRRLDLRAASDGPVVSASESASGRR